MSLPYALGPRQQSLYVDRATLYKLNPGTSTAELYTQKYEDVPFLFAPTPNFDTNQGQSQPKEINIYTSDTGNFHADQEIGDKWVVYIQPGSLHGPGSWHKVLGASRTLPVLAKSQQVYLGPMLALKPGQIV